MTAEDDEIELTEDQEQYRDQMIETLLRTDFNEVAVALASGATGGKEDKGIIVDGVGVRWQVVVQYLEICPDLPPEIQTILCRLKQRRLH